MTLAFKVDKPDLDVATSPASSLQSRVHWAIASHTEFSLDRIVTQDNRVKYTNTGKETQTTGHLDEVFQLMRQLNEAGVESDTLGRLSEDGTSFKDALCRSCAQIASEFGGKPLIYVELGPEPTKTRFILKTLRSLGVVIDRYVAVDINPMSVAHMRQSLQAGFPDLPLHFVTCSFEEFRLSNVLEDGAPAAVITMLGFQEGNDDPFVVNEWLRDIARPGDLLLSESQLYTPRHLGRIPYFYAHPAMRRFSRIAFEQSVDSTVPTLNRFFLLPVPFRENETTHVAVLGEEFSSTINGRNLHVSNFCLKLTHSQYRHYREHGGYFEITGETFTDDETLHFQLSRRV
ncbi:L-histidine N(alpha)-methyltransferase [Roseibium sp. HPY-6]|uniref:L-histidine N(alpha)-methyltransferase n=1 Tax=Roseibium sp. HPY-6 TaxID=3229852 RepID=UPI00338D45D3